MSSPRDVSLHTIVSSPAVRASGMFLLIFLGATFTIAVINRTVEHTGGRVVRTFTKTKAKAWEGVRKVGYMRVEYRVDGKEYLHTCRREKGTGSVPVYYYSWFPGIPWCHHRRNGVGALMIFFTALSGIVFCSTVVGAMRKKGRKKRRALKK